MQFSTVDLDVVQLCAACLIAKCLFALCLCEQLRGAFVINQGTEKKNTSGSAYPKSWSTFCVSQKALDPKYYKGIQSIIREFKVL